jgi:FtsZ-binding cell division protein ZapB
MNFNSLTRDEASFLLFSFKKTLRDRVGLTPAMIQFYESGIEVLKEKIPRLEKDEEDQRSYGDRVRDRNNKIQTAWTDN